MVLKVIVNLQVPESYTDSKLESLTQNIMETRRGKAGEWSTLFELLPSLHQFGSQLFSCFYPSSLFCWLLLCFSARTLYFSLHWESVSTIRSFLQQLLMLCILFPFTESM